MHKIVVRLLCVIDSANLWAGRIVALLIPVVMLITSYEVIMRYLFRSPTIWAWDINVQLLAVIIFFGGGYLLLFDGHVRVDVLYTRLSEKRKNLLNIVTAPIFFIYLIVMLWKFAVLSLDSIAEREVTNTLFAPPVYPLKIVCTIAVFFFLLQGASAFVKSLQALLSAKSKGSPE